jgi:asparagine synthase (glutamine-hydrolysing)
LHNCRTDLESTLNAGPSAAIESPSSDAMIGGPHAQSIMHNLVARSGDRYYSQEMKQRLGSFVAYEDLALDVERMRRWHPLNRSLYLGYKLLLAGLPMTQKGDRVAMANSVEARYPFLDEEVIAFAARIHPRWKLHGFLRDKYLLRRARSVCCRTRSPGAARPCSGRRSPSRSCRIHRLLCVI